MAYNSLSCSNDKTLCKKQGRQLLNFDKNPAGNQSLVTLVSLEPLGKINICPKMLFDRWISKEENTALNQSRKHGKQVQGADKTHMD